MLSSAFVRICHKLTWGAGTESPAIDLKKPTKQLLFYRKPAKGSNVTISKQFNENKKRKSDLLSTGV